MCVLQYLTILSATQRKILQYFINKKFLKPTKKNQALTSVHSTPCQVVHYVKIIRLKHLGKKAMKQQGTWLVYCLSFVYEAVFKFNYYSKLNSNRHQETSLYMTKLKKKKPAEIPTLDLSNNLAYIRRNYSVFNNTGRHLSTCYCVFECVAL